MKYKIFYMEEVDLNSGVFTTKHESAGKVTIIEVKTADKGKTLFVEYLREVDEKDVKKIIIKAEDYKVVSYDTRRT